MLTHGWLKALKLQPKIYLLCAALLVPSAVLVWQLIAEKNLNIDFAQDERGGVRLMQAALPPRQAIAEGRDPGAGGALSAAGQAELAHCDSGDTIKAFLAAGASGRPAFRALAAQVADGSKLILDPDLDTYYLMDALMLRLPEDADNLEEAAALLGAVAGRSLSPGESFKAAAWRSDWLKGQAAYRRNLKIIWDQPSGGQVRADLEPAALRYLQARADGIHALEKALAGGSAAAAAAALKRADAALFQFWTAGFAAEDRMLAIRVEGFHRGTLTALGLWLGALALCLWLAWAVIYSFLPPLRRMNDRVRAVVDQGDLRALDAPAGQDEVAELGRSVAAMVERLRRIPLELAGSVGSLERAVGDLDRAAEGQRSTTARQATALHETQVTAEEIRQMSRQAAESARAVSEAAARVEGVGREGGASVAQSTEAMAQVRVQALALAQEMSGLGERIRRIGDITAAVKDLADQSNMLALNAAIEAQRAGEHGKGFALVAREMRRLADQSIESTLRVRDILAGLERSAESAVASAREGTARIETGLSESHVSAERLQSLAALTQEASAIARRISEAVAQQNTGVAQVFAAVTDQNRMMQESQARLEEMEKAVGSVKTVAGSISQVLAGFRV